MAFNSHSPKFPIVYESDIKEMGRIGPGSYEPYQHHKFLSQNGSECVFKSTKQRVLEIDQIACPPQVGPGKYEIQSAYTKFVIKKKVTGCQSSFKSKIDRFPQQSYSLTKDPKENAINIYEFLLDNKKEKMKTGKLCGLIKDKNRATHAVPSIPSIDQSYGYRIDQKTKSLVQNENPNILLGKRAIELMDQNIFSATNVYNGPGCNFYTENKKIKGPKWHKENLVDPKSDNSLSLNDISIKKKNIEEEEIRSSSKLIDKGWSGKGNALHSKDPRFKYSAINNKKSLLLNAMKAKFGDYLQENQKIEDVMREVEKRKKKIDDRKMVSGKQVQPIECFLTKQSRFQPLKEEDQNGSKYEEQLMNKEMVNSVIFGIGFGTKSIRFEESPHKIYQVGPGSYFSSEKQSQKPKKIRKGTKNSEQNEKTNNDSSIQNNIIFKDTEQ